MSHPAAIHAPLLAACSALLICFAPAIDAADLLSVYRLARSHDAQYLAAQHTHTASRERVPQAIAELLPNVSIEYSHRYTDLDIRRSDSPFPPDDRYYTTRTWNLTLTQPIFEYASYVRLSQARAEQRLADARLRIEQHGLLLRVAERYLSALAASDLVTFTQAELTAVERQHTQAERRYQVGMGRRTDLHDAKARLASVRADVVAARQTLEDALQGLREVTGRELDGPLAVLGSELPLEFPEPPQAAAWVAEALQNSPRLQAREHAVEVASDEVRRQRSGHYPGVELVGRLVRENRDSSQLGDSTDEEDREVLLRAVLPLYAGGQVSSRTDEAVAELARAREEHELEARRLERETRAAYHGIESSIERIGALAESVTAHELAVEAKRKGFEAGIYLILAVLDAERDLYATKRDYARARYDYLLNLLRLKQAVGRVGEEDFVRINGWLG